MFATLRIWENFYKNVSKYHFKIMFVFLIFEECHILVKEV